MDEDRVVLILHGWGGNKPEHWQEHLFARLSAENVPVYYPALPNPANPNPHDWLNSIRRELGAIARFHPEVPLTVVAHSLGSIAWLHFVGAMAASPDRIADRVLLVAPPYLMACAPPQDAPPGAAEFFPPPLYPSAIHGTSRETVIVSSANDDYITFDQAGGYAAALQIPLHKLEGAGHISPYYGYGQWPWVEEWCLGRAELPPLPRTG